MKELVRIINKAGKRSNLTWLHEENRDIVKAGDLIFKVDCLAPEELGALISFFGKFPEENTSISQSLPDKVANTSMHQIEMSLAINHLFVENIERARILEKTNLIQIEAGLLYRVLKGENGYKYILNDYMELVASYGGDIEQISSGRARVYLIKKIKNKEDRVIEVIFILKDMDKADELSSDFNGDCKDE